MGLKKDFSHLLNRNNGFLMPWSNKINGFSALKSRLWLLDRQLNVLGGLDVWYTPTQFSD